jgi:type II secretory pathway pseudopilin PulG
MSDYVNGPLIALGAVAAVTAVAAIVTTMVSTRRKERERLEAARQRRLREAEERARLVDDRRKRSSLRPKAKRRPSVPAPGRTGFRTDRDPVYNDTTAALMATGILYDHTPYDSGSRNDPSPSPSYDSSPSSSSSDSGSSWGSDSGSSSGGGGDY